jgi:predicted RNA-binding Zn-ribbon protein involved in translation (DUF1610 family)
MNIDMAIEDFEVFEAFSVGWPISSTSAPHLFHAGLADCLTCSSVLVESEEKKLSFDCPKGDRSCGFSAG